MSHGGVVLQAITVPRAPSPEDRRYLHSARDRTHVAGRYPGFVAPTGSCAGPKSSRGLGFPLVPRIFAGCCAFLLEVGPSRRYLRESFLGCLDPYPGAPHGASTRFFPRDIGLPQHLSGSARHEIARTTTSVRRLFSGLQSFTHVQAPGFARHPGRSHRKAWFPTPRAAVTFTSTHISVRYLSEQWIC